MVALLGQENSISEESILEGSISEERVYKGVETH